MKKISMVISISFLVWGLMGQISYAVHEGIAPSETIKTTASGLKYLANLQLDQLSICSSCGYLINHSPRYESVAEANKKWRDDTLVLGVRFNGVVRAYPLPLLQSPCSHIINDVFNDTPIALSYCPLCASGVVFERPQITGQALAFATAGLYKRDLVMYDDQTFSLWQQFTGELLAGPLLGEAGRLHRIPADVVPWGQWKQGHPDTQVLADWQISGDSSSLAIYREIARGNGAGAQAADPRLPSNALIVGIVVNGAAKAYLEDTVNAVGLINDTVGGVDLLVLRNPVSGEIKFFKRRFVASQAEQSLVFALRDGKLVDQQTESVWNFEGEAISGKLQGTKLEEIAGMPAFWFAWVTFYPDTDLFK